MDTGTIRTFLAIAENESFSRAAEQLYLTQPAVSKRLSALETELDARLFDRIGRKVLLTEAGRLFFSRARRILRELEDSITEIENLSETIVGHLSLGTSHHIGLHRMPPVLRKFSDRFPQVELDLQFMNSEAACAAVLAGKLELAVVTLPEHDMPHLRFKAVWPDPLVVVLSADHPLLKILDSDADFATAMSKIAQLPAILPQIDTVTRQIIDRLMNSYLLDIKVGLSTNYLETIRMLVRIGMGWSVLPRSMLDDSLQVVTCPEANLSRHLGIVWHAKRTLSNAAKEMLALIQQYATT